MCVCESIQAPSMSKLIHMDLRRRKKINGGFKFYYNRIKKDQDQGKYVTFTTMMNKEVGEV